MKQPWHPLVLLAAVAIAPVAPAKQVMERWDGVVAFGTLKVPFSMQIEFDSGKASAIFTTGETPVKSSAGTVSGDTVLIQFDSLGAVLEATQNGGSMKGTYTRTGGSAPRVFPVELNRFCTCGFVGEAGPDISGRWSFDGGTLVVERKGDDTFGTLREGTSAVDHIGLLSGRFDGVSFTLSHFTGTNAALLDIEPGKDGKLTLNLQVPGEPARKLVAVKD